MRITDTKLEPVRGNAAIAERETDKLTASDHVAVVALEKLDKVRHRTLKISPTGKVDCEEDMLRFFLGFQKVIRQPGYDFNVNV